MGPGGLIERPAVGEEIVHLDAAVGDEGGAFGLTHRREGPGADQRDLPPQHVGAYIQGHLSALADEACLAPGTAALNGLPARLGRRGGIERSLSPEAVRRLLDRRTGTRTRQNARATGRG